MVERTKKWQDVFRVELPRAIQRRKMTRGEFVKQVAQPADAGGFGVSTQAVYKWLNRGQISDSNLEALAALLECDYATLLVSGKLVPKSRAGRRRNDHLRDAAAGYSVEGLPTADEIAERWETLPAPVQAFLLQQILVYEEIAAISPELNKLMFTPPKNENYPEYERELEKWQREHKGTRHLR